MTLVQKLFSEEIEKGLSVNQISEKYSIIPAYIERQLNKIEERKCLIKKINQSTISHPTESQQF